MALTHLSTQNPRRARSLAQGHGLGGPTASRYQETKEAPVLNSEPRDADVGGVSPAQACFQKRREKGGKAAVVLDEFYLGKTSQTESSQVKMSFFDWEPLILQNTSSSA